MYDPYRFAIMKRDDAKMVYANVQKTMFCIYIICGLAIILFGQDVIKIVTTPSFYDAYQPIPFLMLAAFFHATYYLLQTGIYVQKQTKLIPNIVWIAVLVNIILNFILIPKYGMVSAGEAKFAAFLVLATMTYFVSQKIYYIRYDFRTNLLIIICGASIWVLSSFIIFQTIWLRMTLNGILIFICSIVMMKFLLGTPKQIIKLFSFK